MSVVEVLPPARSASLARAQYEMRSPGWSFISSRYRVCSAEVFLRAPPPAMRRYFLFLAAVHQQHTIQPLHSNAIFGACLDDYLFERRHLSDPARLGDRDSR